MILFSRKENLAYAMQDRYTLATSTTTKKQSLESKVEIHRETLTCRPRIKLNLDPHFNIKGTQSIPTLHLFNFKFKTTLNHLLAVRPNNAHGSTLHMFWVRTLKNTLLYALLSSSPSSSEESRMTTHNLALPNTVAEVEAPAVVRALDFDFNIGFFSAVLEGDSKIIINSLKDADSSLATY